ncbi:flavonoid 3-hydroxylase [Aspergillus steynii IBT 23096]|uniref:Flavonoid 3-hydroxylase n=1 Tax=Aspergillus steynii IBT 23096 TaxID=1392250 RepID=A0A2I2FWL8_9EURO|nr:flavonoid 3-hydroxylase [Aspergillus steynii IBT 23096]PLB45030.1 flavonoid 3-hydroxylase [Aspergillus steynii IBT 23096]
MSLVLYVVVGAIALYISKSLFGRKRATAPLPPGPPGKLIIGNLRDLPPSGSHEWLHWWKYKDLYGPISALNIFGQTLIIINDADAAITLFEKRSAVHSARPEFPMAELSGWDQALSLLQCTPLFRTHRKALHRELGTTAAVARFNDIVDVEVRKFLLRVIQAPNQLMEHIRKETGAAILKIGYGYNVEPKGRDPLVDLVEKGMGEFCDVVVPHGWLVNLVPAFKHFPSWLPGGGFKKTAEEYKQSVARMRDLPYYFVKRQMAEKKNAPSFVSSSLGKEHIEPGSEEEMVLKWSAVSLYAGGADATVSSIACFFLAMALYPAVQKRAQEEIDRVVGTSRLPGFQDRDNLPYINAMVQEILRWHPIAPVGFVHKSSEEDIYEGYRIPKGAIMIPNIWGFMHDPAIYADPMTFKPERFLSENGHTPERDPNLFAFGFGRRICPGKVLANADIYLTIAQAVASLRITNPVKDGKEVPVTAEFLPGVISHPAPFEVAIRPRSAGHEALIREVERLPEERSHAEEMLRGV